MSGLRKLLDRIFGRGSAREIAGYAHVPARLALAATIECGPDDLLLFCTDKHLSREQHDMVSEALRDMKGQHVALLTDALRPVLLKGYHTMKREPVVEPKP